MYFDNANGYQTKYKEVDKNISKNGKNNSFN